MFDVYKKGTVIVGGGSHTNFDTQAFGVGAFGAAAMLAGALGAGLANARARRQSAFANWQEHELRAALQLSEAFRANDQRIIRAQAVTIARYERAASIERINRHRCS